MITELTAAQKAQVAEYRDRYSCQATSTEPADRPRAEKAAFRLAEISGVKIESSVEWTASPELGMVAYKEEIEAWMASLGASLGASLRASLRDSLGASLRASLWDSLWASLRDSDWLAHYSYGVNVLGVECECSDETRELLDLHNEIAASCFALWITPTKIILCDRPTAAKVVDKKLVDVTFGERVSD